MADPGGESQQYEVVMDEQLVEEKLRNIRKTRWPEYKERIRYNIETMELRRTGRHR